MGILSSRMRKVLAVLTMITLTVTPVAAEEFNVEEAPVAAAEETDLSVAGSEQLEEAYEMKIGNDDNSWATGYIPMQWEREIPMPEEDVSWTEIKRQKVSSDVDVDTGDYTPRPSIPVRFPGSTDEETKRIISEKYPVPRNQGNFGTCWAYAALCSSEFFAINNGMADKSIDLSEEYLAYGIYKKQKNHVIGNDDAVSDVYFDGNDAQMLNLGGNYFYAAEYLMKDVGFIKEEDLPYILSDNDTRFDYDGNLHFNIEHLKKKSVMKLNDMCVVDISNENGAKIAKEALLQNGAVATTYWHDYSVEYFNNEHKAYYYDGGSEVDHGVSIVGWDDNFPKEYFNEAHRPQNNGAWLIRNSWNDGGDFFDIRDYFWISYEDTSLHGAYIFESAPSGGYDNNYYYDTQIHEKSVCDELKEVANVFEVKGNTYQKLTEVVLEVPRETNYKITVYRDLKNKSDPASGTCVTSAITEGKISFKGIYTIPLKQGVLLKQGSSFSVVVETTDTSICFEMGRSTDAVKVTCGAKENQSFVKENGEWIDWTDHEEFGDGYGNFVIEAHTVNTDEKETDEIFKDSTGKEVVLIHDIEHGTYKTADGDYVFVLSREDGKDMPEPNYQYTGKRICPSKKTYVVWKGVMYAYKTDYTIQYKKGRKRGEASAKINWKKESIPYRSGIKTSIVPFSVVEREVSSDMVNFSVKNDKIRKLIVKADGIEMKPKKNDYSYTGTADTGFTIIFANNYKGTVIKKG